MYWILVEVWPCLSKFRLEDLDRCVLTPAWNSVGLGFRVEGWASTQGGTVDKKGMTQLAS